VNPKISIITGTMNRPKAWGRFIASVYATMQVPFEVIVADASGDPRYVQEAQNVRVLVERPRLGHVRGYCAAFKQARAPWVCWFNDDVQLILGWDIAAITFMQANRDCGIGAIYFKDQAYRNTSPHYCLQSLHGLTYANFGFLPRSVGEELGWFDEAFWMYGADTDLSFRAVMAGYAVTGIPGCKCLHYRENDFHRKDNHERAQPDNVAFKARWDGKGQELRQKHAKHTAKFGSLRAIQ
jgi:GT2 family glycosyltransferase